MTKIIDQLIINSPFEEPKEYWNYNETSQSFDRKTGRRPAGYYIENQGSNKFNDDDNRGKLPLVDEIRKRVKAWKTNNYTGITSVTRKLIKHWYSNVGRNYRFFFCQLDAIETIIWLAEAPETEKTGIVIEGDGGEFKRICTKLCTGGGKTTVMAMLIAWQVCNKVSYPQDKRFSKNIFIVAPGITVRERLNVLNIGGANYYTEFSVVPTSLIDSFYKGNVVIKNWQALAWDDAEALKKKKSVDKRGPISDEAYARQVLDTLANSQNILVINDEAHHAWRKNPEIKVKYAGLDKKEEQEATIWVSGLDRIHRARKILTCYDFSATPFAPSGKKNESEALFPWIVSDFGLNDGIESGLVKTPRMVVRDDNTPDAKTFRSKLNHIYADDTVKDNIGQSLEATVPLPDLVIQAYNLLGADWLETYHEWKEKGMVVPPVMITVANRTETSSRIEHAFKSQKLLIKELCDPKYLLRIDSKMLEQAEAENISVGDISEEDISTDNEDDSEGKRKFSKKKEAERLRKIVNTVGQENKAGEQIRNLISVGMLTEGWDAKTVTHIMGLRAFSSQLLCEQVVGRGLRRTSYEIGEGELYKPEYVNIFGIPFSFLPYEGGGDGTPPPPPPKYMVQVNEKAAQYEISWPNIIRIDHEPDPRLTIDISKIEPLTLDASQTRLSAEVAPFINGKPDLSKCEQIDLINIEKHWRMQEIIFKTSAQVYETLPSNWKDKGTPYKMLGQVFRCVEKYLESGKIILEPPLFMPNDPLRRKIMYMLNMNKIVNHLWKFIECQMSNRIIPMFNPYNKVRSTGDMTPWWTSRHREPLKKSHISHIVYDSTWEATEAYKLEKNPHVTAFAKNDHLGFGILYTYEGVPHIYYPDFLVKLDNGKTLVLETKGQDSSEVQAKKAALAEWVEAVNSIKEYGEWCSDISFNIADVDGIIQKYL